MRYFDLTNMYFYFFDAFLSNKKYKHILTKIERRVIDLGIEGRFEHLNVLKNLEELIIDTLKRGAKTIVAAGNDHTVVQIINAIADNNDVVLGIIPIGKHNKIAELLGIPRDELACDVISNRLIEKIDLGKINHHYFLTSVKIANSEIILECDDNYKIIPSPRQEINVFNLERRNDATYNPRDGFLETSIACPHSWKNIFKNQNKSLFPVKKVKVLELNKEKSPNIFADGLKVLKKPITIQVAPKKLKVIVGKERKF